MALVIALAEAHSQADIMDVMCIVSAGVGATAPFIARAADFASLTAQVKGSFLKFAPVCGEASQNLDLGDDVDRLRRPRLDG
jgi:hypothetical protein